MNRRKFIKNVSVFTAALALPVKNIYPNQSVLVPNQKPNPSEWKDDEINVAWIGHATVLINFYGTIILTDPVLYERVGLYFLGMTFGPNRFTLPALEVHEIPKPDLILLSHAHMDHMDYATLSGITSNYPNQIDCLTAYNTKDVIENLDWKSIQEIDWGEQTSLHGINFKALEVKHFGWRYPWEWDRSKGYFENGRSYNAILLEKNGKKILFGGDTAYHELFKPLQNEMIDIAIMPIGAYQPWRKNHCNPEEALIMASEHMNAKFFIPIHTKTFKQGSEPIEEPLNWLIESGVNYKINIGLSDIGETFKMRT